MIATRSKAKYYDPHNDLGDDDIDEGIERDEVGLVRKICVKVLVSISLLYLLLHDIYTGSFIIPTEGCFQMDTGR